MRSPRKILLERKLSSNANDMMRRKKIAVIEPQVKIDCLRNERRSARTTTDTSRTERTERRSSLMIAVCLGLRTHSRQREFMIDFCFDKSFQLISPVTRS